MEGEFKGRRPSLEDESSSGSQRDATNEKIRETNQDQLWVILYSDSESRALVECITLEVHKIEKGSTGNNLD